MLGISNIPVNQFTRNHYNFFLLEIDDFCVVIFSENVNIAFSKELFVFLFKEGYMRRFSG